MKEKITIRRATVKDVDSIFMLTQQMSQAGLMLSRSKYKIITMLSDFFVAINDPGDLVGCGALAPLWTDLAEICALGVNENHQKKGIGRDLVKTLIDEGKRLKVPRIITLTYQIEFFKKMGFTITDKDRFPRKVWRECLECPKLEHCDETAMYLQL